MTAVVKSKALWNAKSAEIGGRWVVDTLGGVLSGVIYIPKSLFDGREPDLVTFTDSKGTVTTATAIDGAVSGDSTLSVLNASQNGLMVIELSSPETSLSGTGLWQIDAQFTTDDGD